MLRRRLASAPLIAGLLIATCTLASAEPRALLELFTSQGCSSCPAADKLLGEFAADPSVVALSVPIDYWDYLGWKDTLASPAHTARQRAYARLRGDRQVYTPQIVVNGSMHALGSDRAAVERAMTQTARNAAIMSLPVLMSMGGNNLTVKVSSAENEHAGARSLAVSAGKSSIRCHRPRRKSRPHGHLPQCREALAEARRLERNGRNLERSDLRYQD